MPNVIIDSRCKTLLPTSRTQREVKQTPICKKICETDSQVNVRVPMFEKVTLRTITTAPLGGVKNVCVSELLLLQLGRGWC